MAISFKIPKSPSKSILTIENFLGADFTNSPANVDEGKSPNTVNMIRDVPGKVRKSMGWEVIEQYGSTTEEYEENYQNIVEKSFVNGSITNITMTARLFSETEMSEMEEKDVVIEMYDYIGTRRKEYVIPNENFVKEGVGGLYASDGFYGIHFGDTNYQDTIDFSTLKLHKKVFTLEFTKPKLATLLNTEGTVYLVSEKTNGKYYHGHITYEDSVYTWVIGYGNVTYEQSAENLADFPISSGKVFYVCESTKEYPITIPSTSEFTLFSRRSKIVCEHLVGFTAMVQDTENPLPINGFHKKRGDEYGLVHAGTNFYRNGEVLYSDANNARSMSWQFEDRLYIVDGKKLLVYYEETEDETTTYHIEPVENNAYIPLITISKEPSGGGTPYEDLNLLSPAFTETFLADGTSKNYELSFDGLDETVPKVEVMNAQGEFVEKTYGTDFTVNYSTGVVIFTTAPSVSPLTGEDNVRITAYRTVEEYANRINKCTFGTLFGVNGALDRLFLSGNPDFIHYDWYSQQYDPTYFTDTSYSMLGSSASAIIGYSVISNYLAAHKDYMEKDQNIILREGDLVENEPSFRIVNTLQGAGAIAKHSFAYLQTEPLFLTNLGVYAVTAQDITGEKYAQNRSYFVDGKLLDEENLEDAFGFVYKDLYYLCLNDKAYILDGLQPIQTDRSKPYATRQYVGFMRTNLPARVMWEKDGVLFFGTSDGRICRFHTDKYSMDSYNDDGDPIEAIWETPDIDGNLFYKNKTLRYIALRLDSAIATSVQIYVMNRGLWQFIKKDDTSGRYLSFMHLIFSKVSFSGDKTQHTFATKVRVKKVDKFRLRLINNDLNEPFGLYSIAFEYIENGNYKG